MPKVDWKSIHYKGYKEDLLPSGKTLLYLHFEDNYGNKYRWTPPWKDLEEVFIKAIDMEKRNYPEGAWDDELKKVIVKSPSRPHDREAFEKSDTIMNEKDFKAFLSQLEVDASYTFSGSQKVAEFIDFFSYESNKYISKILHDSCRRMLNVLNELTKFLWETGLFFDGPYRNDNDYKMRLWPAHEIIVERGVSQEERDKQFFEYFDQLRSLVDMTRSLYMEYRANIREILFI
jgi:hypothetical protein